MPAVFSSFYTSSQLLARACKWVGLCLIALFLITVLGSFLPPRALDPDWQLALAGNLIDNGAYSLLGLLLIALAAFIDPENSSLQSWQLQLRALACWVSIAYLLLAPAIGVACKRGLDRASLNLERESRTAQQAIIELRSAINASPSLPDLQGRFRQMQAPPLPPDAASIPLADLKSGLLERLRSNESALQQSLRQPLIGRFWPTLQKALRNMLASLVLGVAYAAVAVPKGASRSQLQSWSAGLNALRRPWQQWRERWRQRQQSRMERRAMAQRLTAIQRAKKQLSRATASAEHPSIRPANWLWKPRRRSRTKIHDYDYLRQISRDDQDDASKP